LDQPFVFSQQGFQAVRASCLGTNKSIHSLRVAASSNSHNGTSFRSETIEILDFPARRYRNENLMQSVHERVAKLMDIKRTDSSPPPSGGCKHSPVDGCGR
jgi:hypothetical protein